MVQVWLLDRRFDAEKCTMNTGWFRTTKFMYWGTKTPPAERAGCSHQQTDAVLWNSMRKAVDALVVWTIIAGKTLWTNHAAPTWMASGVFLIQHGGTMSRLAEAKGKNRKLRRPFLPSRQRTTWWCITSKARRNPHPYWFKSGVGTYTGRSPWATAARRPGVFSERKNFVLDPLRKKT